MYIKNILSALFIFLFTSSLATASSNAVGGLLIKGHNPKPNIIWISVDDVGRDNYYMLGAYQSPNHADTMYYANNDGLGSSWTHNDPVNTPMPNLLHMTRQGVNFTGAWSGMQCQPTREMLRLGLTKWSNSPTNATAVADGLGTAERILATDPEYEIVTGGKTQFSNSCLTGLDPTGTANNMPALTPGPAVSFNLCLGQHGLTYDVKFARRFNEAHIDHDTGIGTLVEWDTSMLPADIKNGLTDEYMHVDENMVYRSIEHIKDTALSRSDGSSGDFHSPWDNHYARPYMISMGFHEYHGDKAGYMGNESPQGYTTFEEGSKSLGPSSNAALWPNHGLPGYTYAQAAASSLPLGPSGWSIPYAASCGPDWPLCWRTSEWWGADIHDENGEIPGNGKAMTLGPWEGYSQGASLFVDRQISLYLKALGTAGLKNTLFIFTGDNGSVNGTASNYKGLNKGADWIPVPDDGDWQDIIETVNPTLLAAGYAYKGTESETGLNVPFVAMGGWVNPDSAGSTSELRFLSTDVAETISQLATPSSLPLTPDGRDFSSLFSLDCHNGACDSIAGPLWEDTYSQAKVVASPSAVTQPFDDAGGTRRTYRIMRFASECDWVQDLSAADPNVDIRSTVSSDADLLAAYTRLNAGLILRGSAVEGGSGC
jgi:hypothetical protein